MGDKVSFDPADVHALAVLERQAKAFKEAIEAAEPALERLTAAHYPGAGVAEVDFDTTADAVDDLIRALEDMRIAAGNRGAYDYQYLVKRRGMTLEGAARELFERGGPDVPGEGIDSIERIATLRDYAASVA